MPVHKHEKWNEGASITMITNFETFGTGRLNGIMGRAFAPFCFNSRFRVTLRWNRRLTLRRWRRFMVLPETLLVVALVVFGNTIMPDFTPGQAAQAAIASPSDVAMVSKRDARGVQAQLRKDPALLSTMNAAQVIGAFSYADLEREEGSVQVLQFRGNECVLHVVVDMDAASVSHYEFNPRQTALYDGAAGERRDVRANECVADILKSRRI